MAPVCLTYLILVLPHSPRENPDQRDENDEVEDDGEDAVEQMAAEEESALSKGADKKNETGIRNKLDVRITSKFIFDTQSRNQTHGNYRALGKA